MMDADVKIWIASYIVGALSGIATTLLAQWIWSVM